MKLFLKIVALSLLLLSGRGFAQKTKFGVSAGATYANIRGGYIDESQKGGFNFLAGLSLELPINNKFSFLTNLNYERKSSNVEAMDFFYESSFFGQGRESEINLTSNYIALPINVKYYIGNKNIFYVNGGLYSAFYIGGRSVSDLGTQRSKPDELTVDVGVNIGVGHVIKFKKTNLNIELRDNLGLKQISKFNSEANTNAVNLILNWEFSI